MMVLINTCNIVLSFVALLVWDKYRTNLEFDNIINDLINIKKSVLELNNEIAELKSIIINLKDNKKDNKDLDYIEVDYKKILDDL
jgi:hypothetical protein